MFLTADSGWLAPITNIFGIIMNSIFILLEKIGIHNGAIGSAIIIFTLITRIILYSMTIKQQKSSKLMSIIQPEINAIQQKYQEKTDQMSVLAQQREMKEVYEKYGVSMSSSCIQLLIQMPIIFALYRVIMNIPAYVNSIKEHYLIIVESLIGNDINNINNVVQKINNFIINNNISKSLISGNLKNFFSDPTIVNNTNEAKNYLIDFLYKLNPLQFNSLINEFSIETQNIASNSINYINKANYFLGLNLATAPNANGFNFNPPFYIIIPILAFVSQYLSIQFMQKTNSRVNTNDEENQMQQTMKSMNLMMPIMSAFFTWGFATGIGIYWISSAVFMTLQQILINKQMEKVDLDLLIKQNIEKANKKRAKKGLQLINEKNTVSNIKKMEQKAIEQEKEREKILEGKEEREKQADKFYFEEENKDSLFAKVNMVSKYNNKNKKNND